MSGGWERALASVEVHARGTRRQRIDKGEVLALPQGTTALVYVVEGRIRGLPTPGMRCALARDAQERRFTLQPGDPTHLTAGDAFLSLGRTSFPLHAEHDTELMISDLQFLENTMFTASLPDVVSVLDFAGEEPSAAALARTMGMDGTCIVRSGDALVCTAMAQTLVLSLLRAWVERGCAPAGWPSLSDDPFLDRVVEAIHSDPGREWTVESLASIGAMSRSVFAERFRAATGHSPASYVTTVRMDAAKRLLGAGRSVTETSQELGYGSDTGFSRAFRRHTGIAPSLWRAQRREAIALSA